MSPTKKSPKISKNFNCVSCNYLCSKISEYNKHISTNKHKILQNPTSKISEIKLFVCVCGKQYKHSSTLYAHKKTCKIINENNGLNEESNNQSINFFIREYFF